MKGEHGLLRLGEYLIGRACCRLPAGAREDRLQEWTAELPAILHEHHRPRRNGATGVAR
jgi:hypothetical protein